MIGCGRRGDFGRWRERAAERWERKRDRWERRLERWSGRPGMEPSSGNRSFDEHRADALRRLEQEAQEFREFLSRLRMAKDRAEFDEFMRARQGGGSSPLSENPNLA